MINEPMTLEVKNAIKRLKNHKTPGIGCEACHYDTRQEKNLEYSKIRYFEKLSGQKAIKKLTIRFHPFIQPDFLWLPDATIIPSTQSIEFLDPKFL
uniref:Uncharacterized protein n=1 Tax=Vespula pensylvanica TaxID=30213 RepID=A0A834JZ68_VESPE|nr:hypothetical protein H0235_016669 [Vespula pensylvanica]